MSEVKVRKPNRTKKQIYLDLKAAFEKSQARANEVKVKMDAAFNDWKAEVDAAAQELSELTAG